MVQTAITLAREVADAWLLAGRFGYCMNNATGLLPAIGRRLDKQVVVLSRQGGWDVGFSAEGASQR